MLPGESSDSAQAGVGRVVSIHARHCCRANQILVVSLAKFSVFQSTPGIAAGRISCPPSTAPRRRCFNPRPALLPGESDRNRLRPPSQGVSIHARHCCRANQVVRSSSNCFHAVSIHARHCCRANQSELFAELPMQLFQSTPGIAAGRIGGEVFIKLLPCGFNPRPALLPGESFPSIC